MLVADDDSIVLSLVRTALQNFGMECHLAADGPKALEAARRLRPQAAILDVNMPGMDGYEVLAAIRGGEPPGARHAADRAPTFSFEEGVDGTDHSKYLWGNAAYALAAA